MLISVQPKGTAIGTFGIFSEANVDNNYLFDVAG